MQKFEREIKCEQFQTSTVDSMTNGKIIQLIQIETNSVLAALAFRKVRRVAALLGFIVFLVIKSLKKCVL